MIEKITKEKIQKYADMIKNNELTVEEMILIMKKVYGAQSYYDLVKNYDTYPEK